MRRSGKIHFSEGIEVLDSPRDGSITGFAVQESSLEILSDERWLRVKLKDGRVGFVLAEAVELNPADNNVTNVDHGKINTYASIATLQNGRPVFVGDQIRCDSTFNDTVKVIESAALNHNVQVHVVSTLREPHQLIDGAVVDPAKLSNHFIGHAMDFNLITQGASTETWFDSVRIKALTVAIKSGDTKFDSNISDAQKAIIGFIREVRNSKVRWGGDFGDPIHFDDGLNVDAPEVVRELVAQLWGPGVLGVFA